MDTRIQQLYELKKQIHGTVLVNEPMTKHTTYRIGGAADFYIYPTDMEDLAALVNFCEKEGISRFVIGNGSNLLIHDEGYRGVVIDLSDTLKTLSYRTGIVSAGAGVSLKRLLGFCLERGLSGLEQLIGIPGQVGGGIMLNAGAYGAEISQYLKNLRYMDRFGTIERRRKDDVVFNYRYNDLPSDSIVVDAEFALDEGNPKEMENVQKKILHDRREKQPLSLPSAGSVFKRPKGDFAGRLIEEAGCKGLRIGDAMVSKKHANFIVNCKLATAQNVLKVIDEVEKRVFQRFHVELETEIHFVGFDAS